MKDMGIYVHIPFCKSKCYYCDFNSFADKEYQIDRYVQCLKKEIKIKSNLNYVVRSIYIGGGTPSILPAEKIEKILQAIANSFTMDDNAEITIEINPGTVTKRRLESYFRMGINRLSIGLQSSNDEILKKIGRIHNYEQFENIIKMAKEVGFENINADAMIGLPEQTIYDVEDTITKLIKMKLTHISVYSLIVEPETKMEKMLKSGKLKMQDEEIERYMYWFTKRLLEEHGYLHYEISNFAIPGYISKHNMDCWNQKEYLGFGVSAASYEDRVRYSNIYSLEKYMTNIEKNEAYRNKKIEEIQNEKMQMNEFVLLNLRKIRGMSLKSFNKKFNKRFFDEYKKQVIHLWEEELIQVEENNVRLSNKGLDLANLVWREFI